MFQIKITKNRSMYCWLLAINNNLFNSNKQYSRNLSSHFGCLYASALVVKESVMYLLCDNRDPFSFPSFGLSQVVLLFHASLYATISMLSTAVTIQIPLSFLPPSLPFPVLTFLPLHPLVKTSPSLSHFNQIWYNYYSKFLQCIFYCYQHAVLLHNMVITVIVVIIFIMHIVIITAIITIAANSET